MPFIQPALIRLFLAKKRIYDVIIPDIEGEVEPLFALYSKNCLPVILEHLLNRDLKIREVLSRLKVKKIGEEEIDCLDPQHLSFFNINTEEEYKKVKDLRKNESQ